MQGEKEKVCASCGAALRQGVSFCTHCGAAAGAAAVTEAAVTVEQPPPAPGAPAPGRSRILLAAGILGGLLALGAAVFLVLYLTLWRGDGGTGDTMALAEKYIHALEDGDFEAYRDCFDPDAFALEDMDGLDYFDLGLDHKNITKWGEKFLEMAEFEFEGVRLEETSRSEKKATVVTTAGTASFSVFGLDREIDLAESPLEFKMIRKKGRWYIAESPINSMMDREFRDMDLEDLEEYLPEDMRDFEDMFEDDWLPEEEESAI